MISIQIVPRLGQDAYKLLRYTVVVAHIHPNEPSDAFFLLEKFIGRLTAWFSEEIVAINVQFISEEKRRKKK
jgi:hypothetical protein